MFSTLRTLFSPAAREEQLRRHLDELRQRLPVPVFWLFGKTQTGKTSIIRYLTGAADAAIGQGFKPCTRFSRRYPFHRGEEGLSAVPEDLRRSIEEHRRRFEGLVDVVVPIDLTPPEEGFDEPNYGGAQLHRALLDQLPGAYRQSLLTLTESTREL